MCATAMRAGQVRISTHPHQTMHAVSMVCTWRREYATAPRAGQERTALLPGALRMMH